MYIWNKCIGLLSTADNFVPVYPGVGTFPRWICIAAGRVDPPRFCWNGVTSIALAVIISDTVINVLLTYFGSEYLVNGGTQRIRVCYIVLSGRSIYSYCAQTSKAGVFGRFPSAKTTSSLWLTTPTQLCGRSVHFKVHSMTSRNNVTFT